MWQRSFLQGEVLVLQPAEIRGDRAGRDPLEGVIAKGRACPVGLGDAFLFAENGVLLHGLSPFAVGAPGFDGFGKQHGTSSRT